uniref:Uncharacterized protein n=1 Tax=Knipowitschia caucasica TaxID=637954 RepID=A0AAV2LSV4_KNICA
MGCAEDGQDSVVSHVGREGTDGAGGVGETEGAVGGGRGAGDEGKGEDRGPRGGKRQGERAAERDGVRGYHTRSECRMKKELHVVEGGGGRGGLARRRGEPRRGS